MTRRSTSALCLSLATGLLLGGQAQAQMREHAEHHLYGAAHAHRPAAGHGAPSIALAVQPQPAKAGTPSVLTFILRHPDGRPLENLLSHHARKVHVVIVSEDMSTFGHIHPQDFAEPIIDGRATVRFGFPRPGRYLIAADIMTEGGPHAETFVIEVAGTSAQKKAAGAHPDRLSVVDVQAGDRHTAPIAVDGAALADGYAASVICADPIRAGVPARFSWTIKKDGQPVTDLRPYLDAPLHLAVVKEDLKQFLHEHGKTGKADGPADHAHGHGQKRTPEAFGPDLRATVTFPAPGRYFVFAQAAHRNKLLVLRSQVLVQ